MAAQSETAQPVKATVHTIRARVIDRPASLWKTLALDAVVFPVLLPLALRR